MALWTILNHITHCSILTKNLVFLKEPLSVRNQLNWCQRDIFQKFSRIQPVWALIEWKSGAGPPAEQLAAMESISQSVPRDLLVHLSLSCTTVTSTPLSSLSFSSFLLEAASVKPPCLLVLVHLSLSSQPTTTTGYGHQSTWCPAPPCPAIHNNPFLSLQWVTFNLFQGPPYNGILTTTDCHFPLLRYL